MLTLCLLAPALSALMCLALLSALLPVRQFALCVLDKLKNRISIDSVVSVSLAVCSCLLLIAYLIYEVL